MKITLLFAFVFSFFTFLAQDANQIVKAVRLKLELVNDYTVDIHVKAQVPMIKIDEVDAKIYYKQPNLMKVESKGIAILPKQGMGELNAFLTNEKAYTCALNGTKMIGDVKTAVVSVLPLTENSDVILVKLWIDTQRDLILKSQITSKSNGTLDVDYFYGDQAKYGLPYKMVFTIDVKKFKLPKSVAADLHQNKKKNNAKDGPQTGTIVMQMRNYKVNQGIPNSKFKSN
ncbi:MAG: outer membrane lipoprotein-sorting protein [Sphingomonadales bacterium]|nr:outer membrane lipoprotein-sorting protein [Sphingomonadales bacterium]